MQVLPIGSARVAREGRDCTLLSIGGLLQEALGGGEILEKQEIQAEVIDARFAKPLT